MLKPRGSAALLFCASLFAALVPAAAQPRIEPLIVVVDASAAMNQPMGGARRIDHVRKALLDLTAEFPGNVPLGMIVFGQWTTGDCGDIEVIEDIQSPVKERQSRLNRRLARLAARGRCAVSRSLLETLRVVRGQPGRILLIAGATDNCGRSPCVVAETLRQSPVPMRADVVAVGVPPDQAPGLACVANRLNGSFASVSEAEPAKHAILAAALGAMPGGRLRVKVSGSGSFQPADLYVTVRQDGRPIAQLSDNPSVFQLPAGEYEVSARFGPHSESERAMIKVRAGETVDQALGIASGVLTVALSRTQGKPFTPAPLVELVRGDDFVASAKSLPARFEAGAGTYGLRVTLNSGQQYVAPGLVIRTAQPAQRVVEVPAGQVQIFVTGKRYRGARRPFVEVYQADRFVVSRSGSPSSIQLLAGSYIVQVRESGRALSRRAFQVKPGEDLRIDLHVP
jgi:hypothetical protein